MGNNPVGIIVRHRCPMPVLLFQHLLDDGFAVFVAWRRDVRPFLDALKSEYLECPHSCRCFRVEWLTRKAEALGDVGIGSHENIIKEPAEYPCPQTHRLRCQADVLDHRASRIGLNLEEESLQRANGYGHLQLALTNPLTHACRLLCGIIKWEQVPDIEQVEQNTKIEPAHICNRYQPGGTWPVDVVLVWAEQGCMWCSWRSHRPVNVRAGVRNLLGARFEPINYFPVILWSFNLYTFLTFQARIVQRHTMIVDHDEVRCERISRTGCRAPR